ncbi:ATPase/DNA packaging protein, partial [Clostridium sp.]|uniref:ATPase/DNA packaging protein n=1 Tax=Clostridium sp. TaxID=1506 RepID=UPI00283DC3CD
MDKIEKSLEKNIDSPIGVSIKRINCDECIHKSKLLCNGSNRISIIGSSGSGKSTVLLQLIPMFTNDLKYIILATVKDNDDAHTAIEKYCNEYKIKFVKVNNPETAMDEIDKVLQSKKISDHALIIFDDYATGYNSSANDPSNKVIVTCYSLLRSFNCSMIMITQSYNNVPTRVRENITMLILFKLKNVFSLRAALEDINGMFSCGDDNDKNTKTEIGKIYKD